MSQITIAAIQSLLVFLQVLNGGIGVVLSLLPQTSITVKIVPLILVAAISAGQAFMNNLGNSSVSDPVKKKLAELDNLNASAVSTVLSQAAIAKIPASTTTLPAPKRQW